MRFFPRVRQTCRRDHRASADSTPANTRAGQGSSASVGALCGHSPSVGAASALQGQPSALVLNRFFISGVLIADPLKDKDRGGNPVTVLMVGFLAPDSRETAERMETATDEVEVPLQVVKRYGKELQAGESIFITGQLTGGGGLMATQIHSGPPPDL